MQTGSDQSVARCKTGQEENSKNSKQALHQTLKMQATESSPAESWAESARSQNRNCSEKQNVSWIKNYTTLQ